MACAAPNIGDFEFNTDSSEICAEGLLFENGSLFVGAGFGHVVATGLRLRFGNTLYGILR